ncbi:uncharacterized protein BDFB_007717 [Asbolus verrucosus]|uniref:Nose resistant-to-fluoxetine protein N-terminal domain-containing protein n=1 Tax=Asbolus verrucosus TaxID=1661398 RepID=A0A482VGE2_ASBVE|nr:uncharacterized protein BDFB_007717 [Asbolus verrucosus]
MIQVLLVLLALSTSVKTFDKSFIATITNTQADLSPKCGQQIAEYLSNLSLDEKSWALQMLDATSKLPSGLLSLNFGEMGDFQQCINVETTDTISEKILGKYCLGYISFVNNTKQNKFIPKQLLELKASSFGDLDDIAKSTTTQGPVWALCIPDGCTTQDVNIIGNALFTHLLGQEIKIDFPDMLCQTRNEVEPKLTTGAIVTM